MLNLTPTYSLADISIIPCELTDIESRKECNCMCESLEGTRETLPIVVAPMSCNYTGLQDADIYASEGINVVIPRTIAFEERLKTCKTYMTAFSLKEAESILEYQFASGDWPEKIFMCIDMANGHMKKQVDVGNKLREKFGKSLVLMGGNIANPKTIRHYKNFDYLRVGIGGGAACLTSTQTATHYSMASLISDIKKLQALEGLRSPKIIADGGISGYSDAIKCLALGADYVMMGRVFTKAALHGEAIGSDVSYYGMSTKKAQKEMGGLGNKTSEGKNMIIQKEYTLSGWVENFTDYLRSAMSYTGSRTLSAFRNNTECRVMSHNSSYAINNK